MQLALDEALARWRRAGGSDRGEAPDGFLGELREALRMASEACDRRELRSACLDLAERAISATALAAAIAKPIPTPAGGPHPVGEAIAAAARRWAGHWPESWFAAARAALDELADPDADQAAMQAAFCDLAGLGVAWAASLSAPR
ncbi:MAG: hypothetical protein ACR2KV_11990 [Solirubrobacteraceae bacterium]